MDISAKKMNFSFFLFFPFLSPLQLMVREGRWAKKEKTFMAIFLFSISNNNYGPSSCLIFFLIFALSSGSVPMSVLYTVVSALLSAKLTQMAVIV